MQRTVLVALALAMPGVNACASTANGPPEPRADQESPGPDADTNTEDGPDGAEGPLPTTVGANPTAPPAPAMPESPTAGEPPLGDGAGDAPEPGPSEPPPALPTTPEATPGEAGELDCTIPSPGRAPLRRLSRFEYENTIVDLLGEAALPGVALPPELGRFGNDADRQSVTAELVSAYQQTGETIAARAMPEIRANFPCLTEATSDVEQACAVSIIGTLGTAAFRRPLSDSEVNELLALQQELRRDATFEASIQALLGALLQGPDFLYRLEFGTPDAADATLIRPSGHEMAARLSYLFWGTQPDAELAAAAQSGVLTDRSSVMTQATRLLADLRARPVIRHFFDRFLQLERVLQVSRDAAEYPAFTREIAELMLEESRGFVEHEIFSGGGTWPSVLTAPRVYVNDQLAEYYGLAGPGQPGFALLDVEPSVTHRRGLLTQGALLTGASHEAAVVPIRRGLFVLTDLLCQSLAPPTDPDLLAQAVAPPADVTLGATTRERVAATTLVDPACASCHELTDPIGFALENYDSVGVWRAEENGVPIDANAATELLGAFDGPFELGDRIAENDATFACFRANWAEFAYGRSLDAAADACTLRQLETAFADSGYDVQALLLALTQTDAFLYRPLEASP